MKLGASQRLGIARRDSRSPLILSDFEFSDLPPRFTEIRDYLNAKAGPSPLPAPQDIRLDEIPSLRPYVNLIDVIPGPHGILRFQFRYIGATQIGISGQNFTGQLVDEALCGEGGRAAIDVINLSVKRRIPIYGRYPVGVRGRDFIMGERIIFPLSSDGEHVDQLLVIHNFEAGGVEEALLWSENRFRTLVESSIQGIWVHRDFNLLFANDGAAKILGFDKADELFDVESLIVFFPPDQVDRCWELQNERLAGGNPPVRYETRILRHDGTPVWVEVMGSVVEWDGVPAILGTFFDISEHKRLEEQLSRRERQFRDLAAGSIQGMIIHRDMKPVFVNQAWCDILGYEGPEEYLAQGNVAANVAEHSRVELVARAVQRLKGAEQPEEYEYEAVRKDGRSVWLRNAARVVDWDGEKAIQAVVINVTTEREAEARLRQAQKMEAVGQLTGGIAHDFNNLLAVISGNAEMLEERVGQNDPHLAAVLRAAQRGADLTQHLLAFSRKQALRPQPLDLNTALDGINKVLRRTLGETIEIELIRSDQLWACEADPGQLENAILNMALNASDAMPDGGKLTIKTSNARLDEDYAASQEEVKPGDYTLLTIRDTGHGIPPETCQRVFEPFFTTKPVGEGSGLGLSMVYGFAKQSGGHVTIESRCNAGATLKLYLPRAAGKETVVESREADAIPLAQGETILVVEDDPDVRALAVALLESLGYHVLQAATGQEALQALGTAGDVDLVLTDVVLPGNMNGRTLSEVVLHQEPDTKVLFMSGYTTDAIVHQGRLDTDANLLQKPFRRAALAKELRRILDDY